MMEVVTGPIAIMLVGYVVLMIAIAFLVQPTRMRLVATIDEMLSEDRWNDADRARLFKLRDNSMSFLVGLIVPIAVLSVIIDDLLGRVGHHDDELSRDPRYAQCVWRFFASLAAANPLAAVVSISLMIVSIVVGLAFRHKPTKELVDEAVEEPTLRALDRFSPA